MAPNASADDIRRAHRHLVRTAHPDHGGSAERFHAIQQAYEILSDAHLRSLYNRLGLQTALREQQRQAASNGGEKGLNDDLFARAHAGNGSHSSFQFFFGSPGGFEFFSPQVQRVPVALAHVYRHEAIEVRLQNESRRVKITFDSFDAFRNANQTHTTRAPSSNVLLQFYLQPHDVFAPAGKRDLLVKKSVLLQDALLGARFDIESLDPRQSIWRCRVPPGTVVRPNDTFVVRGKGVPPDGDLLVQFDVQFPADDWFLPQLERDAPVQTSGESSDAALLMAHRSALLRAALAPASGAHCVDEHATSIDDDRPVREVHGNRAEEELVLARLDS